MAAKFEKPGTSGFLNKVKRFITGGPGKAAGQAASDKLINWQMKQRKKKK